MAELINHNSFLLSILFVWGGISIYLYQKGTHLMKSNNFIGISLLLVVIYFAFRPAPPTSAQTAEIQTQIGTGTPVLLEFQSPY